MIRYFFLTISLLLAASLIGQNSFSINGNVKDQQNQSIPSATIVLKAFKDSSLVKVEMTFLDYCPSHLILSKPIFQE